MLRADIVQHFASVDHAVLLDILRPQIQESDVMDRVAEVVESGCEVLDDMYEYLPFLGDDLLTICRPRGLPIGNATSQFWFNCDLHPFDEFVKRELRCRAYLRYVDDLALFSDSKRSLGSWKSAIVERLVRLRLVIHAPKAQVRPVDGGIPWLGFVVYQAQGNRRRKLNRRACSLHSYVTSLRCLASTYAWYTPNASRLGGSPRIA